MSEIATAHGAIGNRSPQDGYFGFPALRAGCDWQF
jgi:hypothetical protein